MKKVPKRVQEYLDNPDAFRLIKTIDNDEKDIFVSFSGGETSGDMLIRVWNKYNGKRRIIVLFANTGQEDEKTLQFIHKIETYYNIPVVWLEAIINPFYGKGITHRVVDYHTAKRHTDPDTPMELLIQKLGIPNKDQLHCTRDLKTRVMEHYLKVNNYIDIHTLVGIRYDEITRATSSTLFYEPFMSRITKKDVNTSWEKRPFRLAESKRSDCHGLNLPGYGGNCRWCHKKTLRKHLTLMVETPEVFEFPERMEKLYENYVHPEKIKKLQKKGKTVHFPIRFFRENKSVSDIREMAVNFTNFSPDDTQDIDFDEKLDSHEGDCSDSCEPFI